MSSPSAPQPRRPTSVGVLVVDDQPVFRRVTRAVIDATSGFEPIGDATSGAEALVSADRLHPDLVLMDVHMPDMDGFETAHRLTRAHPESVVVLISLDDVDVLQSVAWCGAAAFVRKQDLAPRTLRRLWAAHGRDL
jgi:two-component system, NarL family, invasion response regulator UvrY